MGLDISDVHVIVEGNNNHPASEHVLRYCAEIPVVAFDGGVGEKLLREIDQATTSKVKAALQKAAGFDGQLDELVHHRLEHDCVRDEAVGIVRIDHGKTPDLRGARHTVTGEARLITTGGEKIGLDEAIHRAKEGICWQVGEAVAGCTRKMVLEGKL